MFQRWIDACAAHGWRVVMAAVSLGLAIPAASAQSSGDPPSIPVIAVLRGDAAPLTRLLSDMAMLELASSDALKVVDVEAMERVLAEHGLTAAGLTDPATQIQLGRLLNTDGLVVLVGDPRLRQMTVRLIAARHGFLVSHDRYALTKRPREDMAADIAKGVLRALGKLRMDSDQAIVISVLQIANRTLSPDYQWIENDAPLRLESSLAQDPLVMVAERRHLARMIDQTSLAAPNPDLRGAGVILDGELTLNKDQDIHDPRRMITLNIRLRDPEGKPLGTVAAEGTLDTVDALCAQVVPEILALLHDAAPRGSADLDVELRFLLDFADREDASWAYEAAHRLAPSNPDVARRYRAYLKRNELFREPPAPKRDESGRGAPDTKQDDQVMRQRFDAYLQRLQQILEQPSVSDDDRRFAFAMADDFQTHQSNRYKGSAINSGWLITPEYAETWIKLLERTTEHPDIVLRFSAYASLSLIISHEKNWANAMLLISRRELLDFGLPHIVAELFDRGRMQLSNHGEKRQELRLATSKAIADYYIALTEAQGIRHEKMPFVEPLEPEDTFRLCKTLLDWVQRHPDKAGQELTWPIRAWQEIFDELVPTFAPELIPPVKGRLLFGPDHPEYAKLQAKIVSFWGLKATRILAKNILHDGNRLWVLLVFDKQIERNHVLAVGGAVLEMDIPSRRMIRHQISDKQVFVWSDGNIIHPHGDTVYVGIPGTGMLVFDMRAPFGTPCEVIAREAGLPNTAFMGLAATDTDVFIGLPDSIARWNLATRRATLLWQVNSEYQGLSLKPGERMLYLLAGDRPLANIYAFLDRGGFGEHPSGDVIIRYHLPGDEWSVVADPISIRHMQARERSKYYSSPDRACRLYRNILEDGMDVAYGDAKNPRDYGTTWIFRFDVQSGTLSVRDEGMDPPLRAIIIKDGCVYQLDTPEPIHRPFY